MPLSATNEKKRNTKKLLLILATLTGALSLLVGAAFATFTSTANSANQAITAGTVTIGLTGSNLGTGASPVAPGDTMQRVAVLNNTGDLNLNNTTLSVLTTCGGCSSSALDATVAATSGLQVTVDSCSVAWTVVTASPPTYSCSGTQKSVLASTPMGTVETTPQTLNNLASLTAGSSDDLRLTITFATASPNAMQALSSTVEYSFLATQRNGQPM